jgi:hypothetical protein
MRSSPTSMPDYCRWTNRNSRRRAPCLGLARAHQPERKEERRQDRDGIDATMLRVMGRPAENLVDELPVGELLLRNREALALIEAWAEEDPEYDRSVREMLDKALNESRRAGGFRLPDSR